MYVHTVGVLDVKYRWCLSKVFFYEKRGHESLEKKTKANIIIAFCNAGFGEGLGVRPSPNNGLNLNSAKNGLMVKISKKI